MSKKNPLKKYLTVCSLKYKKTKMIALTQLQQYEKKKNREILNLVLLTT